MAEPRKTALHAIQVERGARMVTFVGWELPVQYEGVVAEHTAVRERVGLFDVSHMGEVLIEGPQALDAVQWIITNNAAKLVDGKALYTVMCLENGGIVDDLIVYRQGQNSYFLCVNAARRDADVAHITEQVARFDCTVADVSDAWSQLALQGPKANDVLSQLTDHEAWAMTPFSWVDVTVAGIDGVRVARTGYTGEHGFELYTKHGATDLWCALEEAGRAHGLALCGLGARDTLRLEMKYALYGNDIDTDHHPIEAGLGWVVKLKKGDFLGRAAIAAVKADGPTRKWVGFKMKGRGIPRHGYPIHFGGEQVGVVTSGTHSPSLGEPIGSGYVPTALADLGSELDIIIRDQPVAAYVVDTPFYKRDAQ
ncbi:MAG: glycine cleavage system aminomethyltransferase GcvT [Myxococcota bacterium]